MSLLNPVPYHISSVYIPRGGGYALSRRWTVLSKTIVHVIVNKEGRENEERENEKAKAFRLMT